LKLKLTTNSNYKASFVTDNSKECDADTAFLLTPLSAKYSDDARTLGVIEFIGANELSELFDLSAIKIIAITGTNGKTTTAAAIYSILIDLGHKTALQGTRGFFINEDRVEEKSLTTPMQLGIYANILNAIDAGCEYFVMEVSSHAIVQRRIEGLKFAIKIISNITQDHLDFHKTFENYRDVKNSFLDDDSLKLINVDDENIAYNKTNAFTYGVEKHADFKVDAYSFVDGICAVLTNEQKNFSFSSGMTGLFNVYNLLSAIASVKLLTDEDIEKICEAVENFGGVSGRMEVVSQNPLVIVDFAHTPDGIVKVLEALPGKKLTVIFGAGGDRDKEKRPKMAYEVSLRATKTIITSDNPRSESPEQIIKDIVAGVIEGKSYEIIIDRREAIKKAIFEQSDDVVIILGKGDEQYQIVGDEHIPFDDREVARELLLEKSSQN
jgi:UDP-N-acetylmuramoyl-L-alanyl-D-glutamate--2,6-diaminopimelate ligase